MEAERTADAIGRTRRELDSEERRLREAAAMLGRLGTQPNATQAAWKGAGLLFGCFEHVDAEGEAGMAGRLRRIPAG